MALYHDATVQPSKAELVSGWTPKQPWYPSGGGAPEVVGAYRFDDPEGAVGMETHMATVDGTVLHIPFTYRDQPLPDHEHALVGTTEHSALGTRWVYDGLGDERFVTMMAAVALTGQGEALGMVEYGNKWHIAPSKIRIRGGGWSQERVSVHDFERLGPGADSELFRNERFELTVHRRPASGQQPGLGLTAIWDQQSPLVLAEIREH